MRIALMAVNSVYVRIVQKVMRMLAQYERKAFKTVILHSGM